MTDIKDGKSYKSRVSKLNLNNIKACKREQPKVKKLS